VILNFILLVQLQGTKNVVVAIKRSVR